MSCISNKNLHVGLPKTRSSQSHSSSLSFLSRFLNKTIDKPKLFYTDGKDYNFYLLKSRDIPQLVVEGKLDIGITLSEWVEEKESKVDIVGEVDWCFTRISLIIKNGDSLSKQNQITCVTEYCNLAHKYFKKKKLKNVKIILLSGSIEGLIPNIFSCGVECVETGNTLKNHALYEEEIILNSKTVIITKKNQDISKFNFILKAIKNI